MSIPLEADCYIQEGRLIHVTGARNAKGVIRAGLFQDANAVHWPAIGQHNSGFRYRVPDPVLPNQSFG